MRFLILLAACTAASTLARAQVGAPYCFGTSCPCANDDPAAGCGNAGLDGNPATGALLEVAGGSTDVTADDLVLRVSGIAGSQFGLLFMGDVPDSAPFGDGIQCIGGAQLYRFDVRQADAGGSFTDTGLVAQSQGFGAGTITTGATWYFQGWYRDPGGPCGNAFNLSNGLPVTFGVTGPIAAQLAGNPLAEYPFFEYARSFNRNAEVHVGVDPSRLPSLAGRTVDLYVVAARSAAEWDIDTSLVDVAGGPVAVAVSSPDVQSNTFVAIAPQAVDAVLGDNIGLGYDVILDVDGDGALGDGDVIDGLSDEAGLYVVRNTVNSGGHGTSQIDYSGGNFLGQQTFFPSDIASLGALPLVVVSHGNGHNYQWYDHIGEHLASHGFVVMSHQNNTMPGIASASLTTLDNTDYLLGNLSVIEGGVLDGHVDGSRIIWIGHSRGGEGVVRAYDRLFDGTYVPVNFSIDDIVLVSSIAPTDFLGGAASNPHSVDYHLWTGSADADVNGGPESDVVQTYHLLERALGRRFGITIQGAGHAVFHNGSGGWVANGPCLVGRVKVHRVIKGHLLPLIHYTMNGDLAAKDFLWRQYESFRPTGAPEPGPDECTIVTYEYKEDVADVFVVEDYQTEPALGTSSSGGSVTFDVTDTVEDLLNDINDEFAWTPSDPMNGMTRARANESTRGAVFEWVSPSFYELELVPGERDLSDDAFLSFRACQGTRHPNTIAELGDLTFTVTLRDASGVTSSIGIGAYGGGIEEPYQRSGNGVGPGTGWANELETVRIRLTDFLANGSALDLSDVTAVRFEFGLGFGSEVGRIGLDDVVITAD